MSYELMVFLGTVGIAVLNVSILCVINRYCQWGGFETSMGMIIMTGVFSLIPLFNILILILVLIHFLTADLEFPTSRLSAFLNKVPFSKKKHHNHFP